MIRDSEYIYHQTANVFVKNTILFSVILTIIFILCALNAYPGPEELDREILTDCMERTYIILLGTGTPNPEPDKHGQAIAIVVGKNVYIVDCGAGVVRRAAAAYDAGLDAMEPSNLDTAFITHLHSDHTLGYPDLILTPWVMGRTEHLRVFGPKGLRKMTDHIIEAYREDIDVRVNGTQPSNRTGYKVDVHEIESGLIYKDKNVEVHSFPVKHGDWNLAYGFRFITPDMNICISGDTAVYEGIEKNYENCDVLIHEVYSELGFHRRPPDWQRYHSTSHTSAVQLGKIAAQVKPGLLVLIHQLLWGYDEKEVLDEIAVNYSGDVIFGRDLYFIGIPKKIKDTIKDKLINGMFILIKLMPELHYNF